MKKEITDILDQVIKDLQERETECYRLMAYCNEHKFNLEREAIKYRQEAYSNSRLKVFLARDMIAKIFDKQHNLT